MKKIFILAFVLTSFLACQKDIVRETPGVDNRGFVTDGDFDFVADSLAFLADDTDAEEQAQTDYQSEVASKMKIVQAITTDSLPIWNPSNPSKKQKFGKRQIINTDSVTRFTLRGYGFKAQSDTSRVEAIIAKTRDTLSKNCTIISWSDSVIVFNVPTLTVQSAITKQFSLKFKVWRSNDKVNKLAVSRVKSRSSISDVQAAAALAGNSSGGTSVSTSLDGPTADLTGAQAMTIINSMRAALGKSPIDSTVNNLEDLTSSLEVGDVLFSGDFNVIGGRQAPLAIVLAKTSSSSPTYTVWFSEPYSVGDRRISGKKPLKVGSDNSYYMILPFYSPNRFGGNPSDENIGSYKR